MVPVILVFSFDYAAMTSEEILKLATPYDYARDIIVSLFMM